MSKNLMEELVSKVAKLEKQNAQLGRAVVEIGTVLNQFFAATATIALDAGFVAINKEGVTSQAPSEQEPSEGVADKATLTPEEFAEKKAMLESMLNKFAESQSSEGAGHLESCDKGETNQVDVRLEQPVIGDAEVAAKMAAMTQEQLDEASSCGLAAHQNVDIENPEAGILQAQPELTLVKDDCCNSESCTKDVCGSK